MRAVPLVGDRAECRGAGTGRRRSPTAGPWGFVSVRRLTCENARQPQPPPHGVGVRAEGAGGARAERRGPQRPAHSTARVHESSLPSETRAGRRAFSS